MKELSQRTVAITAGIAFFLMTIAALFAYGFALGHLIAPGDATATVNQIMASPMLLRLTVCSFLIVLLCDVVVAWALYLFLRPVNENLALLMAWLRLMYAAMLGIAMFNLLKVLLIVSDADYLTLFTSKALQAQVFLFLKAFMMEWSAGLLIFGVHLFLLGYLVLKAGYIPKILGGLLIIGAFCYVTTNFANLLWSDYEHYKATLELLLSLPMALGELSFAFWLLFKGGKAVA
ncbi:DUF4386 domain-containing protein [Azotosporobacter soli]|uniref:DUF4386 domain-containing protein n=1 Tax=Azotosporobacter soli TaxID=3055040 RepID=UPI0031FF0E49